MNTFRFRKFKVYQDSLEFRIRIKKLTSKRFPSREKYVLSDQMIRAANSIVLNIAEGVDRSTDKDFALFLNRSHTSLNEVVACLDIALEEKYITLKTHAQYLEGARELADQLTAFRRRLLVKPTK